MPLNKLENFIKNAEGRILYVNPNDLDSTDGIENQGNSLTKPFKTIQRALLESARFSYLRGDDNDLVEKTTILVFPGNHLIDNRPGYGIRDNGSGNALAVAPGGATFNAQEELTLTLNSNFDLTQEDNILYKFNSVRGGIIIPRGTSIVGLDLRKTKVRPKYVPNPTDPTVPESAIFRITGACYFWQFTFFDGDETGTVYTDPRDFSSDNKSKPTFSHHKLTCFEYADGVNKVENYDLTDLDMFYSKVSNAYNRASGREVDQKFPAQAEGLSKQRPEWEIVGAFASDPVPISTLISGDGATPGTVTTVTTQVPHELNAGTPIKIRGVSEADFNISTKVVQVINDTTFTYALPSVRSNLPAGPAAGLQVGGATVTIETDTVSGASPYIFNCSLRSVFGMNGMHADGSKADGFRSMVVAQFTAVSLQKDDRAFTKYDPTNRIYDQSAPKVAKGEELSQLANSANKDKVYHLDSDAVYREGWQSKHIKMSNDAVIQIVSVFAIGFHKHFECLSGGDASITNSNSNFGQFSLAADGFKKEAFTKDDKGYITSIIPPKSISTPEIDIEWVQIDVAKTKHINVANRIYLLGYDKLDVPPPIISQGYRIGARVDDKVFLSDGAGGTKSAKILMTDAPFNSATNSIGGTDSSAKVFNDISITFPNQQKTDQMVFNTTAAHNLKNGETVRIYSEVGDLPEGLEPETVYFAITSEKNGTRADGITLGNTQFQLASSKTNAEAQTPIFIKVYGDIDTLSRSLELRLESRVSDKNAGDLGHPIQFDNKDQGSYTFDNATKSLADGGGWFIHTDNPAGGTELFNYIGTLTNDESEITVVRRKADDRSLDEKLYRIRYVVPKEFDNTRDPVSGFVLQDSSSVNVRETEDHNKTDITRSDYDFNRNPRFLSTCTYSAGIIPQINSAGMNLRSDLPHNLKVGDTVIITDVADSTNPNANPGEGFNGEFVVGFVDNDKEFKVSNKDVFGVTHAPGTSSTNIVSTRDKNLPRFSRNNNQNNFYIYRVETITNYIKNIQDGVFYLYVLNAANAIDSEFTIDKYSQKVTDLYPQLDRDNFNDNPAAANSFAKRTPIGEVVTDDLKRSITRETVDLFYETFDLGNKITTVSDSGTSAVLAFGRAHQLNPIRTYTGLTGGTGHTPGEYANVKLFNNGSTTWDGATANVTVGVGGDVTAATIVSGGSGYTDGERLNFDTSNAEGIGGSSSDAFINTQLSGISSATGDYVQITGISTVTDGYYRITNASTTDQISIAKTAGDPRIDIGQYAIVVGKVGLIKGSVTVTNPAGGFDITFETTQGHGLVQGNQVRLTDTANNNVYGDYFVKEIDSPTKFTINNNTGVSLTNVTHVLKHGMSANDASADSLGENLGTRSLPNYGGDVLFLGATITTEENFVVTLPTGMTDVISRFPLGSYIQVNNEIMRVKSTTLLGGSANELQVIRGSMGTIIEQHFSGTQIKKIDLQPIELRRPSILRASGHTFEYLGYGPGNYSTGLPQVQVKTLTEDEEFLSQAQETSCGTVLYTGMDSDGDFYIGNTKYSAQSGEQTTFDVPTPTVTGEDPNRLSVVFDEIIVKERILVEGGKSKQILSQFDGPVTYNGDVRMNKKLVLNNNLRVTGTVDFQNENDAANCDDKTASLRVKGGVAIKKKLFVCGNVDFGANLQLDGTLTVDGESTFNSKVNLNADIDLADDKKIILGNDDDFEIFHNGSNNNTYFKDKNANGGTIFLTKHFIGRNAADTEFTFDAIEDGGVRLYYNGLSKIETTNGGGIVRGDLEVTEELQVNQDSRFAGNTVQITNNKVTATRFEGTADIASEAPVHGTDGQGLNNHNFALMMSLSSLTSGTVQKLSRDQNIKFNTGSNELRCDGDIIAFVSDERLKTDIVGITNALDKVNSLSGFTYTWTEWASEQGNQFDRSKRHVGVSAQEVQKVLPEAVAPAPFNDEYLTVKYDKIVPLLIEAIKELSDKVSALEDKLNK